MTTRAKWVERTFTFDFPIELFPSVIERLRGTPARLEEMITNVPTTLLITRPATGKWSIQEHAGHLYDLDDLHDGRIDDFLNGLNELRPADMENKKTFGADHNAANINELLAKFKAERMAFVKRLEELDEATISKTALHPRLKVPMRLVDMAYFTAEHDDHHLATITEIKKAGEISY
jgi:uncharacterized damage-inducible protein DinB